MEKSNPGYDPFTYQPMMRMWYTGNALLPEEIARKAIENPDKAQHIQSVYEFAQWTKANQPDFYEIIATRAPDLLDPTRAVLNDKLGRLHSGMSGLGQDAAAPGTEPILTQWGTQLLDLAKGWMVYDAQRDLMRTNISRAERGLPPIDPGVIAPQVQVGIAPDVRMLMYFTLAGLVIVGLASAMKNKRFR